MLDGVSQATSPLYGPPLSILPELFERFLERNIWPQVVDSQTLPRQRISLTTLEMLHDRRPFVRMPMLGHNRVMHELKSDRVDRPIRNLFPGMVCRVRDRKDGTQFVQAGLRRRVDLSSALIALYDSDRLARDLGSGLIQFRASPAFQRYLQLCEQIATAVRPLSLPCLESVLFALYDQRRDRRDRLGDASRSGPCEDLLVCLESASQCFIIMVQGELCFGCRSQPAALSTCSNRAQTHPCSNTP